MSKSVNKQRHVSENGACFFSNICTGKMSSKEAGCAFDLVSIAPIDLVLLINASVCSPMS